MAIKNEVDPSLRANITSRLKSEWRTFSPRLQVVAKYIIDHPSDFGLDSIRATSTKIGVSTFTLVRMATTLGLSGFDELREPFRRALLARPPDGARDEWVARMAEDGKIGSILAEASTNTVAIVERSLRAQDAETMARAADIMLTSRDVFLTATRASYALAYFFHYVGRMALPTLQLIPRHMNSPIDELRNASADDVLIAITFTPYSRDTIEACRFARSKGAKLILISDSDFVVPELSPDVTLIASNLSTHYFGAFTGAMAVIESLIAILVARGGDEARTRIADYEELRNQIDAYWRPSKKQ